jgi:hypothetical protein
MEPGGAEAFRQVVRADVGVNRIDLGLSFPVVILSGVK